MKAFRARLFAALCGLIVFLVQLVHLFLSVVAFDKVWDFVDNFLHSYVGKIEAVLALTASVGPLAASLLIARAFRFGSPNRCRARFLAAGVTLYYALSAMLLGYRLETGTAVDPFLLGLHFRDAWGTTVVLARPWAGWLLAIGALVWLHYKGLLHWYRAIGGLTITPGRRAIFASGLGVLVALAAIEWQARSSLPNLILEFRQPYSEAKLLYSRYFENSLERNQAQTLTIKPTPTANNLFVFQLESLNARLVNAQTTPRLVNIAGTDGIFFPRIQGSTVFTILSMETILCSTLPTLGRNLSISRDLFGKLVCLPEIMRRMGYRTLYFQNFPNLGFANADNFLRAIGFDERHSTDVMQPEDRKIGWGYVEDIYYQRVFDYLRRFDGQKIFAYILVGATNHYPFGFEEAQSDAVRQLGGLLYPNPAGMRERISNTTFLQDYYFGKMYTERFAPMYGANSNALVLGDHSWPIAMHKGNEHNMGLNGTFQENFVTSLAILPARDVRKRLRYDIGKRIDVYHTYLDILPTIMEMYGIGKHSYYGSSFYRELFAGASAINRRCLASVQPFAGGSIVLLQYPLKHIFTLRTGMMSTYDLDKDPDERSKPIEKQIGQEELKIIDDCLKSISDENETKGNS